MKILSILKFTPLAVGLASCALLDNFKLPELARSLNPNAIEIMPEDMIPSNRPAELSTGASAPSVASSSNKTNYGSNARACLVEAMYFEARGTGYRGMRAVGEVILNRAASSKFPNSVCGVVDQRWNGSCQFSYRCDGIPEVYRESDQKRFAGEIADDLLHNRGADITNGALFFHAARMTPGWFATLSPRGRFGGNIFYR